MSERWGDELEWCRKHGGYHLRNEDGGIAVVTEIEDAQTLARLLNAAQALADAVEDYLHVADRVRDREYYDDCRTALAAYCAAREGASDE